MNCRTSFIAGHLLGLVLSTASPGLLADDAGERARLVRLEAQLETLERAVADAAAATQTTRRIQFQYHWLMADLLRIRSGIREYRLRAPTQPRSVPPINGEYLR